MKRIERGTFLQTAAVAAAATLNFLYPGLTRAAGVAEARTAGRSLATTPGGTLQQVVGPDPSFAGGEVVAKTADGVVLQSGTTVRAVRIPPTTVVWKEFEVTPDVIQLQDWLDVKGTPLADGSLLARSGWVFVNIGRRDGIVGQVASPTSLVVQHEKGTYTMELSPRLEVISAEDGSLLPGGLARLTPGTPFGAVGLRLPNQGFRATRIWLYS